MVYANVVGIRFGQLGGGGIYIISLAKMNKSTQDTENVHFAFVVTHSSSQTNLIKHHFLSLLPNTSHKQHRTQYNLLQDLPLSLSLCGLYK